MFIPGLAEVIDCVLRGSTGPLYPVIFSVIHIFILSAVRWFVGSQSLIRCAAYKYSIHS